MASVVRSGGPSSTHTEYPLHIVDAFTKEPFAGNPAAVCLLQNDADISDERKQQIAAEMNLSETAFVSPFQPSDSFARSDRFRLRWFTPAVEVDLCGHATLASATVVFQIYGNINRELKFETRSGILLAVRKGDSVALDFPQLPPRPVTPEERSQLQALIDVSTSTMPEDAVEEVFISPNGKLLVRLKDHIAYTALRKCIVFPDHMLGLEKTGKIKGVMVTLKGSKENGAVDQEGVHYDFVSRYFAPWLGIAEDPVTGSAHSVLAPYWSEVLHKSTLYARQCSRRGGDLVLTLLPNDRVEIAGHARIIMNGKLTL